MSREICEIYTQQQQIGHVARPKTICTPNDESAAGRTNNLYVRLLSDIIHDKIAHRLGQTSNRKSTLRLIGNRVAGPSESRLARL